jgi:putative tricarboxylic transport membrane protein
LILRRDHIAGGVFVVAGVLVLIVSNDLPFGTLASPGAGMLPVLVIVLMILFGLVLLAQAGGSPPMAEIAWNDLPHALRVTAVAACAAALYNPLGFILTMILMLFVMVYVVERRGLLASLAFCIPIPLAIYAMFEYALKSPLERGLFWF